MAWTVPATPVTLTTITVAFYNVNIRDNLNQLRANTGSADPGAVGKMLVSDTAASAAWLAPGAEGSFLEIISGVPTYLVPTIVDTSVPSTDSNSVPALLSNLANRITAITGIAAWKSNPGSTIAALITSIAAKLPLTGGTLTGDLAVTRSGTGQPTQGVVYLGDAANGHWIAVLDGTNLVYSNNKVWHEGNDGPTSGLAAQTAADATTVGGHAAGSANDNVPINNGVENTNLNAALLSGIDWKDPESFIPNTTDLTLTTTFQDVATITTTAAGHYIIDAAIHFNNTIGDGDSSNFFEGRVLIGAAQSGNAPQLRIPGSGSIDLQLMQLSRMPSAQIASGTVIHIQARKTAGTGASKALTNGVSHGTRVAIARISP